MMLKRISMAALALFFSTAATAGGFYIPEQGVRGMAMGNAYTAIADDASAIWFNPAGIGFQDGTVITAGADVITPTNEFTPTGSATVYKTKSKNFFVPHGYVSYGNENLPVTLGLGIYAPFGLSTDWSGSGAPFTATATPALFSATVSFSEIQMANINPTLAYKVSDNLSVAVGADYYKVNKVVLNNQILLLNGNGDGWGANVGVLYKEGPYSFGVSYRTRVKADISGTATGAGPLVAGGSTSATTSVTFPDMLNVGAAYKVTDAIRLSMDVDWVNWKTFDKILVNYTPSTLTAALGATSSTIPENWKATTTFRLGAEWAYNEKMVARAGYAYDPSPITDVDYSPRLPGNDRQLLSLGYSYNANPNMSIDLAYAYVWLKTRNQTASAATFYNGTYKSNVHLFALGLTARL